MERVRQNAGPATLEDIRSSLDRDLGKCVISQFRKVRVQVRR